MKEIIKYLEEIKEHQMQTVQLARTTEVYKLADKALTKALTIHGVSGLLPIGTTVKIKNDILNYGKSSGKIKKVTGYRKFMNNPKGGYELDNCKQSIWINYDFEAVEQ